MINEGDGIQRAGSWSCRTNSNVIRLRSLFVDKDGGLTTPLFECTPPPHIIVQSSPGKAHAYWLVEGLSIDDFKELQIALEERFKSDHICDLARVMRLPGFYHNKAEPVMTKILRIQ